MIFKQYECDFGIKYNGVSYFFDHVVSYVSEDPEMVRLTRGANAGNKTGLIYKEGIKDPKKVSVTIMGMSAELKAVLDEIHSLAARCDVWAVAKADGSSSMGKNAVLCQPPRQLNLDETAESMNVILAFETYDLVEDHKS